MKIRTLQADDGARLLAFEAQNRAWFEQHVAARDPAFYTAAGVAAHIGAYLQQYAAGAGVMHPCVLTSDDGAMIVGRANLRHIARQAGTGEVGYRIGHDQARQGLGGMALAHLRQLARERYGLRILSAWITPQNHGSLRVAEQCGFQRDATAAPVLVQVDGAQRAAYLYQCRL